MGRNRKKSTGAVEEVVTTGAAPEARTLTPEEVKNAVFNTQERDQTTFAINESSRERGLEPEGVRDAWNNTPAATLERGLITNVPLADALQRMYSLPTPREFFGIPTPTRTPPAAKDLEVIAGALAGAENALANGYSAFRDELGLDGLPTATSNRVRIGRDTRRMVGRIADMTTELTGIQNLTPQQRAQVTAIMDAIGGLGLTRERMYETMILTQGGRNTPKGRVLKQGNDRIINEVRRLSMEINRIMGADTTPFRNLPREGTPGYEVYQRLFGAPGGSYDFYLRNHKAPLYANRGLEGINND